MIESITWEKIQQACENLAIKIQDKPNRILAITKGGLIPARLFADIFDIPDIEIIDAKYYVNGTTKRLIAPMIVPVKIPMINPSDHILLVDEILDTGKTMVNVYKFLKEGWMNKLNDKTGKITCVVLCSKVKEPKEIFELPIIYDWYTTNWIIFPWDKHEYGRLKDENT